MKPLKHIDEHIREVFSQKLGNIESPVAPELWNAVQAKISAGATTGTAASSASSGISAILKIGIAALVVAGVAIGVVVSNNKESEKKEPIQKEALPTSSEQITQNSSTTESSEHSAEIAQPAEIQNAETGTSGQVAVTHDATMDVAQSTQSTEKELNSVVQDQIQQDVNDGNADRAGQSSVGNSVTTSSISEKQEEDQQTLLNMSSAFEVKKEKGTALTVSFDPKAEGEFSFEWDFGDGNQSDAINPSHTYDQEGEYLVVLRIMDKNQRVLTSEQTIQVYVPGAVVIPNVFTPNGDGSNDIFDPSVLSQAVDFDKVVVFDRQGKKVFESHGDSFWDGRDPSGMPCEPGQYQYIISAHDRNHEILEKKGYVTLIR